MCTCKPRGPWSVVCVPTKAHACRGSYRYDVTAASSRPGPYATRLIVPSRAVMICRDREAQLLLALDLKLDLPGIVLARFMPLGLVSTIYMYT